MKVNVLPADTFIVVNKTILNEADRKNVIMLYQPIIGQKAVSLYFTLWTYLGKQEIVSNETTHHGLITNMQLKLSEIVEAREKLEAIGLLKTYVRKTNINNFVYQLYSPISAYEFLNNPVLSVTLYNNIGKTEYERIIAYYKVPKISLKDYEEITLSFTDVFKTTNISNTEKLESINSYSTNELKIDAKIDLDNILELLPDEVFNKKSLTKDTKELINKIAFIYNYDDTKISELIRVSLNDKKIIDKALLKQNARKYYQFENGGKLPSVIYRTQPEYLKKPVGDTSIRAKAIYQFENTTPYDFLAGKYKAGKPSKTDISILEYLLLDMNLNAGVVNVLIDYVLKINNNKLTKNFVDAIASQWAKSKIETVEEAMNIAEKEYKKKKTVKKLVETPAWFDKNIESTKASNEDQKEIDELLSKYR